MQTFQKLSHIANHIRWFTKVSKLHLKFFLQKISFLTWSDMAWDGLCQTIIIFCVNIVLSKYFFVFHNHAWRGTHLKSKKDKQQLFFLKWRNVLIESDSLIILRCFCKLLNSQDPTIDLYLISYPCENTLQGYNFKRGIKHWLTHCISRSSLRFHTKVPSSGNSRIERSQKTSIINKCVSHKNWS